MSATAFCSRTIPGASPWVLLLCVSCSNAGSAGPAWPEQPSPSYPTAAPKGSESASLDDTAPPNAAEPSSGNTLAKQYQDSPALTTLSGKATYYADSLAGNQTANGDIYDPKEFTAAHKKLPFGTIVRVVREDNGAITFAKINDRGPFGSAEKIIDLSRAAAEELDMMKAGVVDVRVEILEQPKK